MSSLGDFDTSAVIYGKFTTYRPSTGAPYTLAGTPALSVYKDNSTTQTTTGVTLTVDFDSVTGFNHFAIDTSSDGTFYAAGSFFDVVITTGTVDSVSAVGTVVGRFTLRKNSSLKPATAGRTLVVDASGLADANTVKIGPTGSGTAQTARDIGASVLLSSGTGTGQLNFTSGVVQADAAKINGVATSSVTTISANVGTTQPINFTGTSTTAYVKTDVVDIAGSAVSTSSAQIGVNVVNAGGTAWGSGAITRAAFATDTGLQSIRSNTAQAGGSTSITLDASASATNDFYKYSLVYLTGGTGAGQYRLITAYVGSTKVATVTPAWATNPDSSSTFAILPKGIVDVELFGGTAGTFSSGVPAVNTTQVNGTAQTAKDLGAINVTNLNTLSGHDPGTTLGTSTLTQSQVTGGAYALNSSSFAFNAALDFTTTQKAATLARVTLTDTVTTYTGNTPQTGDAYAIVNSGTYGNAAIKGYVDDIGVAGAGLTAVPWNSAWNTNIRSSVGLGSANLDTQLNSIYTTAGLIANKLPSKNYLAGTNDSTGDLDGTVSANVTKIAGYTTSVDVGGAGIITFLSGATVMTVGTTVPANITQVDGENISSDGNGHLYVYAEKYYDSGTDSFLNYPAGFNTDVPQTGDNFALLGTSGNAGTIGGAIDVAISEANAAHNVVADATSGNPALYAILTSTGVAVSGTVNANPVTLATSQPNYAPAKAGDAMTLTSGERNSVASAFLNLTDGIETDVTFKQAIRAIAAGIAGVLSGAGGSGSGTVTVKAINNEGTTRLTVTTDADGNRSAFTYNL